MVASVIRIEKNQHLVARLMALLILFDDLGSGRRSEEGIGILG